MSTHEASEAVVTGPRLAHRVAGTDRLDAAN
jgi:hypothetical protein